MCEPRTEEALELVRCAEVNIRNLVKLGAGHPILELVAEQVNSAIAALEGEEPGEPDPRPGEEAVR